MKPHCQVILLIFATWMTTANVKVAAEHSREAETVSVLADRKAPDFFDTYWYLAAVGPTVSGNIRDSYMHLKADGTVDVIIQGERGGTFKNWSLSADGKSIMITYDASRAAAQGLRGGDTAPQELQIQGGGSTLKSSLNTYKKQRKGPKEKRP